MKKREIVDLAHVPVLLRSCASSFASTDLARVITAGGQACSELVATLDAVGTVGRASASTSCRNTTSPCHSFTRMVALNIRGSLAIRN